MERLTERSLDYCTQLCSDEDAISCAFYKGEQEEKCWRANMYDRLAAYEDTGLEPEQCAKYAQAEKEGRYIVLKEPRSAGVHRLEEIARADIEGRLAVLPCKVGDEFYRIEKYCDDGNDDREMTVHSMSDCEYFCGKESCDCEKRPTLYTFTSVERIISAEKYIGKTVFLTRADAEAALKGVSEDA